MKIHSTAVVEAGAEIADDVEIGPGAFVEAGAIIGPGCRIKTNAQILGSVTMGADCIVHGGAILGDDPQDFSFDPDTPSRVVIGDGNTFRENFTVHRSTKENGETRIGNGNFFMACSHVGHDAVVGNENVLANAALLGGFVTVGNNAFLGGGSAMHQFVRVGSLSMIKGVSGISRDVPPYCIVGDYNVLRGLNSVGLRRAGFSKETRSNVKLAFNHMLRSGLNLTQALETIDKIELKKEAAEFIDFFRKASRKGICTI